MTSAAVATAATSKTWKEEPVFLLCLILCLTYIHFLLIVSLLHSLLSGILNRCTEKNNLFGSPQRFLSLKKEESVVERMANTQHSFGSEGRWSWKEAKWCALLAKGRLKGDLRLRPVMCHQHGKMFWCNPLKNMVMKFPQMQCLSENKDCVICILWKEEQFQPKKKSGTGIKAHSHPLFSIVTAMARQSPLRNLTSIKTVVDLSHNSTCLYKLHLTHCLV